MLVPAVPMFMVGLMFWVLSPSWSHPFVVAALAALVAGGAVVGVRRILRNEAAVVASSRPLNNYRWLPQWDAAQFLRQFELFLRVRGWRIIDASAPAPDRILIVADKSKSKNRIALLGVRPGRVAGAADLDALAAARSAQLANRAALILEPKPTEQEVHSALERGILTLRFADLPSLEEALNVVE
jgi:hypothetical protein